MRVGGRAKISSGDGTDTRSAEIKSLGVPIQTRRQHLAVGRLAASVTWQAFTSESCGCVGESESARAESVTLLRVIANRRSGLELEQFLPDTSRFTLFYDRGTSGSLESEQNRSDDP